MPVTTRATARHGYRLRRWSRRVRGLTGGVLVLVGGVAMWLGFLGGVLAFFVVLDTSSGLDPQLRPQILTVWLWVAAGPPRAQRVGAQVVVGERGDGGEQRLGVPVQVGEKVAEKAGGRVGHVPRLRPAHPGPPPPQP